MSEPRRWKDMPDAPVGVRDLIGAAKRPVPLDEGVFRRNAERVGRASLAPVAVAAASVWAKLAAAGLVGVAAAGTVVAVDAVRTPHDPPVTSVAAPASPPVLSPAPVAVPVVEPAPKEGPEEVAPAPREVAPPQKTAAPPSRPVLAEPQPQPQPQSEAPSQPAAPASSAHATLSEELSLLEDAKRQMERSPETALARLEQHRAKHPTGVLAAERDLMEIDALRRTGRVAEARSRALTWLERDPQGMHAARLRAILRATSP